jgi:hypothetical protein
MTDNLLPLIPKELLSKWDKTWHAIVIPTDPRTYSEYMYDQCAQWGADQELDACCAEVSFYEGKNLQVKLRAARRPKPPTLKEQALAALGWLSIEPCLINGVDVNAAVRAKYDTIRKALETLPND